MSFLWPWVLAALLIVPLLIWAYRRGLRGEAGVAALHPDLRLLAGANTRPRPLRRHLPAALYLSSVALAIVALARPTAPLPFPDDRTTVILSVDVSLSMNARDIQPSRVEAAQEAARDFVRSLPPSARVGLVSFAGYAVLNTPPTTEHRTVLAAIDALELGRGTAIGAGLTEAVRALPGRAETDEPASNLPPAAVVLLSDGRNNRLPEPQEAAALAKTLGVKVYTVGLGTEEGTLSLRQDFGGFGNFGGGSFVAGFDAEALMAIAETTGGRYFEARSAGELRSVYRDLGRSLGWTIRPREVSGFVGALAGLLLLGSLAASERLTRRIV